jgi:hypothetical protein
MTTDSILQLAKTVGAFILLVLVVLVAWVIVSPIAYGLRFVLYALGLPEGLTRFAAWLRTLTPVRLWNMGWSLLPAEIQRPGGELRLVVDNRLASLQRSIRSFADSTRKASTALVGLGSSTGPAGLAEQVRSLREDIEKLGGDESPYDIDDSFIAATAEEMSAKSTRRVLLALSVIIILFNGAVLSEAFRNWGMTSSLLGIVQLYVAMALAYVVIEILIGLLLRIFVASSNYVLATVMVLVALAAIGFEIYVTDQIGLSRYDTVSQLDVSLIEQHAFGLFGFILATVNCGIGYTVHQQGEIITRWKARQRIVRDAGQWNGLLVSLPERLDKIRNHIGGAQGSLDNYLVSVGGHSDAFTGAVDTVSRDREAVITALRDADMNAWPQWIGSDEGDRSTSYWLSVGIAVLTIALGVAFVISFASQVQDAFPRGSDALITAGTIGSAIVLYLAGFLFLSKIQLIETPDRRTAPLRVSEVEKVVAGVGIVAATLAVWGFSIYAHGWSGVPVGALNSLLAAGMVALGTQWDRFWRGVFGGSIGIIDLLLASLMLLGGIVVHIIGWLLIALGKILLFVLGFIGLPTELILKYLEERKRRAQPVQA